jgi:Predicted metal-dependent membrane protease
VNDQKKSISLKIIKSVIPICIPFVMGNIYIILLDAIKNMIIAINGNTSIIKIITLLESNMAIGVAFCSIPIYLILYKKDMQLRTQDIQKRLSFFMIISILFFAMIASVFVNNIIALSGIGKIFSNYVEMVERLYTSSLVFDIIGLGIITPIAEELLFRGIMYQRMKEIIDIKKAAFLISLLFGVYHGNVVQGFYAFVLSLLMIFIMEKSGSIVGAILFHMAANIVAVILENIQVYMKFYEQVSKNILLTTVIFEGIITILFIYVFHKVVKTN